VRLAVWSLALTCASCAACKMIAPSQRAYDVATSAAWRQVAPQAPERPHTSTAEAGAPRIGLRRVRTITATVSAYTVHDDPGYGRWYASVNFLPGGRRYDQAKPYPRSECRPARDHYTIAVPTRFKAYHEARAWNGRYWGHRYFFHVPGYNGISRSKLHRYLSVPRDRCLGSRWDVLMTGWNARQRALEWGVKTVKIEVWEVVYGK